eukprot:4423024-Amphidinium_carterae.1
MDVNLESAEDANGDINFSITLPLNSCDENDYPVADLDHTVIWAFGSSHTFAYHGSQADVDRGATMLNLISGPSDTSDPANSFTVDIIMPSVPIAGGPHGQDPANPKSERLCVAKGAYHVTKYEQLIQAGNHPYVHNMVGNPCLAAGGCPTIFPPEAGFPLQNGVVQYFAIQMHCKLAVLSIMNKSMCAC